MLLESCSECVGLVRQVAMAKEAVYQAREACDSTALDGNRVDCERALADARIAGRLAAQALKDHVKTHGPHAVRSPDHADQNS